MKRRISWLVIGCVIVQFSLLAKGRPGAMTFHQTSLTPDRALAAIRSASPRSGTSLKILREVKATTSTQEIARRSHHEANLQHVALYGNGIFLNALNTGAFLILESDPTTGNAVSIYLVSSGNDGRTTIESHEVEGNLMAPLGSELVNQTADFVDALLAVPTSKFESIERRFYGGHFPEYAGPGARTIFAMPRSIRTIEAEETQYRDLAALFGGYLFWPVRYAMSTDIYAANPSSALAAARKKHEALTEQFLQKNNKKPDFIYDLQDLESLKSPEQLRERISWLRRLDDFLEQALKSEGDSSAFEANKSISLIALQLGSLYTQTQESFLAVTSPGLVVGWRRSATGALAVAEVSLAEETDRAASE